MFRRHGLGAGPIFSQTHRVLAALVLAVSSCGCRSDPYQDAYLEMLNAEKRALEDRLYDAEYNYEQALAKLKSVQAATNEEGPPARGTQSGSRPRPRSEPADAEPRESPELPTIELPPGVEEGRRTRPDAAPAVQRRPGPPLVPASAVQPKASRPLSDQELAAAIVSALDQRVETIHLNPRLTHGADFDGKPGDDGISVLIEPRNRHGSFVPEAGRMTIVLLDPSESDEAARLARWDLDADSIRKFLQTDSLDSGVLLRLPWQDKVPEGKRLHLFVRYLTEDGRKLETDRQIEIASADLVAQRWTPRREPIPERAPRREATASWVAQDDAAEPVVTQAVAEQPIKPAPQSPAKQSAAVAKPAADAEEAAVEPVLLEPAPAKPISPRAAASAKTDSPGPAPQAANSRPAAPGQFWKPDR